jgi:hypothetical protein
MFPEEQNLQFRHGKTGKIQNSPEGFSISGPFPVREVPGEIEKLRLFREPAELLKKFCNVI